MPRPRHLSAILAGALVLAGGPARAQAPPAPESPATLQLAAEKPRPKRSRPPVDAHTRRLRQYRSALAGGIIFTALGTLGIVGLVVLGVAAKRDDGTIGNKEGRGMIGLGTFSLSVLVTGIGLIDLGVRRGRALRPSARLRWPGGPALALDF